LFLGQGPDDREAQPTVNLLLRHGVRSCLEYAKSGDLDKARRVSNPDLSPHASFVDMGGHGYAVVRASRSAFEVEFVCIPRPLERSESADGGPLRYRTVSRTELWENGKSPKMEMRVLEGDPRFSIW
jgi:alkaline phosphatase D